LVKVAEMEKKLELINQEKENEIPNQSENQTFVEPLLTRKRSSTVALIKNFKKSPISSPKVKK